MIKPYPTKAMIKIIAKNEHLISEVSVTSDAPRDRDHPYQLDVIFADGWHNYHGAHCAFFETAEELKDTILLLEKCNEQCNWGTERPSIAEQRKSGIEFDEYYNVK